MLLLCAQRCLCNPRPPPASAGQVTPTLWLVQGPRWPKDPNAPGRALFIWISGARRIYAAMRFLARSNVGSTSVGARRCYRNTLRYLYNNIIIFRYTICDGCWCFSWGPTYILPTSPAACWSIALGNRCFFQWNRIIPATPRRKTSRMRIASRNIIQWAPLSQVFGCGGGACAWL